MMLLRRIIGVMTFRLAAYREIVESANLRRDSALLMIVPALANTLIFAIFSSPTYHPLRGLLLQGLLLPLISWVVYGYVGSFLIRILYKTHVPAVRILNILGYAAVPEALGALGIYFGLWRIVVFGSTVVGILIGIVIYVLLFVALIAGIIGIREAAHLTTYQTIIIGVLCQLALGLILAGIGGLIAHV